MVEPKKLDAARRRLLELAEERGETLVGLSLDLLQKNRSYLENWVRKGIPKELKYEDRIALENRLRARPGELKVDIHKQKSPSKTLATENQFTLPSVEGGSRSALYQILTETVYLIGTVQAGAWSEAYQLPEEEWTAMTLPADPRYPGIPRYALGNAGQSMNRVCKDGGKWIFVRFSDLTGQGPSPGQYVIVERVRKDGLVEATAKKFRLGQDGARWLDPESDDPSFRPIPMIGDEEIEEIRVVGRVVDIINHV